MPRMSLRQMLVWIAVVALAIVSLKYASVFWSGAIGLAALVTFVGSVIAAVTDRGQRQAFAIGMALAMTIYSGLLFYADRLDSPTANDEFFPFAGRLPTSNLLSPLHFSFVTYEDVVENGQIVRQIEHPDSQTFMTIGHYWWALVFGYAGGRFAQYLYVRRNQEAEK
jgi:hypothetical protein